ncbi:peroxidase-like isoform X2 [Harmonia axyridis]|uniref:peroxidase-like isoform X2 n=1 Tax=Harmonia axyridis TaxID=115357 RepID=UPI001E279473|nr:peroxidase-like isoform X2 [Harmonia axyridis]
MAVICKEEEFPSTMLKYYLIGLYSVTLVFICHGWNEHPDNTRGCKRYEDPELCSIFPMKKINWKEINKTIIFVQNIYIRMETREKILGYADIKIETGTPSHGLFVDSNPEPETTEMMKVSLEAVAASSQIAYEYCTSELLRREECGEKLRRIKLWKTALRSGCQRLGKICMKEDVYSKYRSIDGSCNNYMKGERGQSFTIYGRLLFPEYMGGVRDPRRSVTRQVLPSAREVSAKLELNSIPDQMRSWAVLFWGQFLEHDMAHTAMSKMIHTGKPIECCDPDGRAFSPRYEHPFCMTIKVPPNDPYYSERDVTCLSYVRSAPALGPDCSMGPMEQINQATHLIDASQIYGVTKAKSDHLRNFTKGLLSVTHLTNSTILEISKNPQSDCQQRKFNAPCYQSGDKRVNTDPHMTAMYTLWVREHNRIAAYLADMNSGWDDETVFQEARRIVIAEIQHITYNEWIPSILGTRIKTEYRPDIDPTVSNEFATAAIRALNSVPIGKLSLADEEKKHTYLHKSIDLLLSEMYKNKFTGRRLYYIGKPREVTYGVDILSVDIQRGRDHGLPTYNDYRLYCGLSEAETFDDLRPIMLPKAIESLKKSYKSVDDLDLIVGGLAEKPERGMFGPTLTCVLKDQFERTRGSDRYFYSNPDQPSPFSHSQLKEIEKVTLARIICDNSEKIEKIPPKVFEIVSKRNPEQSCDSKHIPRLDLQAWNNERYTYNHVTS